MIMKCFTCKVENGLCSCIKNYVLTGTVNKNISFRKTLICNLGVSLCVIFVGISSQLTLSNMGWVLVSLGLTSQILHPFKLLIPLDLMYSTVQGIIMERQRESTLSSCPIQTDISSINNIFIYVFRWDHEWKWWSDIIFY